MLLAVGFPVKPKRSSPPGKPAQRPKSTRSSGGCSEACINLYNHLGGTTSQWAIGHCSHVPSRQKPAKARSCHFQVMAVFAVQLVAVFFEPASKGGYQAFVAVGLGSAWGGDLCSQIVFFFSDLESPSWEVGTKQATWLVLTNPLKK